MAVRTGFLRDVQALAIGRRVYAKPLFARVSPSRHELANDSRPLLRHYELRLAAQSDGDVFATTVPGRGESGRNRRGTVPSAGRAMGVRLGRRWTCHWAAGVSRSASRPRAASSPQVKAASPAPPIVGTPGPLRRRVSRNKSRASRPARSRVCSRRRSRERISPRTTV